MKNITVSVPDEVHRRARMAAAERDTSVSALVREFLESLDAESDFARRVRLEQETLATITRFSAQNRLSRDAVYDRRKLR